MDRKWLIVLPSMFTVSSIFCGVYAILVSARAPAGTSPEDYFRAALAILGGMFLDGCDGRVARLTRTQSDFGVQLDSLADVISFGAAPAVLLYQWALHPLGGWGVLVAGLFAACGAIRLARFNVLASRSTGPSDYFVGLPIPLAAGMVVAVVVATARASGPVVVPALPVGVLAVVLSYLMVSTIRYRSFKKVSLHSRELAVLGLVVAFGVVVAVRMRPSLVPVAYFSGYVLAGLAEEVLFKRRRQERMSLATSAGGVDDGDAGEP